MTNAYLFTYGTLQDPQVQQYIFGRELKGTQDRLLEFKWFENAVYGRYPLVKPTGNPNDSVKGMVYGVTEQELKTCDVYETSAYRRRTFILASGIEAWVYIENSD